MGWSCAAKAALVRDAIVSIMGEKLGSPEKPVCSNALPNGGFWETSRREHVDGSITGTCWRKLTVAEKARWAHLDNIDERMTKSGSFKITGEGKIVRFPGLTGVEKAEAEKRGAAEYTRVYES